MAYAPIDDLKAHLKIDDDDTTDDLLLRDLLEAYTARMDVETGRNFEARTATRYYEADSLDGDTLRVNDLLTITTLTNGDSSGTTIPSTEYWLTPRNEGPPYDGIRLKSTSTYYWEVDVDYWISVAGTWGWSATPPADIAQACIDWAAWAYRAHCSTVPPASRWAASYPYGEPDL